MSIFMVALLLVAVMGVWLFYKKSNSLASTSNQPTLRLQGDGKYESLVLGVARFRPALEKICGRDQSDLKTVEALLVSEDVELHDKIAVRVEVQGRTVGYLPADLAVAYRRRLLESGYPTARSICSAKVIPRMHSSLGGNADYAVRLDLPQKRSNGELDDSGAVELAVTRARGLAGANMKWLISMRSNEAKSRTTIDPRALGVGDDTM